MEKPFVVCHMFTSVNGKIDGEFMSCPDGVPARTEYGNLRNYYHCEATLYGTVTMAGGFSDGLAGALPASTVRYPKETWAAPSQVGQHVVAVDPRGTLGWDSPYMEKRGRPKAHVIEALTEQVSEDYLAYLRSRGVSYVVAGKEQLDCGMLLYELKTRFGIERLMLAGGGYVNGSFLQAGVIDEVSIVSAPAADGNTRSVSAFENHDFLACQAAVGLSLLEVRRIEGDGLWLRYAPQNLGNCSKTLDMK